MRRLPQRQNGFVLLMTLVCVVLVALATVGMARRSFQAAVETKALEADLRQRWAATGLQALLMPQAEALLIRAERVERKPRVQAWHRIEVGGFRWDVVVADEQAKADVNQLLETLDAQQATLAVRQLSRGAALTTREMLEVRLRPLPAPQDSGSQDAPTPPLQRPSIAGFGQVYVDAPPQALMGTFEEPGPTSVVTCWGGGPLNIRRAPAEAVRQVCSPLIGQSDADRLVWLRDEQPRASLAELIMRLDFRDEHRQRLLTEALTDRSSCHSLWLVATGPRRSWHTLVVESPDAYGGSALRTMAW